MVVTPKKLESAQNFQNEVGTELLYIVAQWVKPTPRHEDCAQSFRVRNSMVVFPKMCLILFSKVGTKFLKRSWHKIVVQSSPSR